MWRQTRKWLLQTHWYETQLGGYQFLISTSANGTHCLLSGRKREDAYVYRNANGFELSREKVDKIGLWSCFANVCPCGMRLRATQFLTIPAPSATGFKK